MPSTLDLEARTAQAILSSGAMVRRPPPRPDGSWAGDWLEKLDLSGANLEALRGAPLLVDHVPLVASRIGSVLRAYIMNGLMHADLKFSARQEVTDLLRDISEGVGPMHFSLSYTVQQWKRN